MSTYCIGDLHGRYDLLKSMLDRINFNEQEDHIYFLGDVLGGETEDFIILKFIMDNPDSTTLILGNHEDIISGNKNIFDFLFSTNELHNAAKNLVSHYTKSFEEIKLLLFRQVTPKNKEKLKTSKVKQWLKSGKKEKRKLFYDSLITFLELIDYDKKLLSDIWILFTLLTKRTTKRIVYNLLQLNFDDYNKLAVFLQQAQKRAYLEIDNKQFVLTHSIYNVVPNSCKRWFFPHSQEKNTTFIFGHIPTQSIHRNCLGWDRKSDIIYNNGFNYDYDKILGYIDTNNNRYYNLDTGSNPISAIRIEDMAQFYVKSSSKNEVICTQDAIVDIDKEYIVLEEAVFNISNDSQLYFDNNSMPNYAFITKKHNCFEYLIGINALQKQIIYTRIDLFDYNYCFIINNWYDGQPIRDIIEKVNKHSNEELKEKNDNLVRILQGYC